MCAKSNVVVAASESNAEQRSVLRAAFLAETRYCDWRLVALSADASFRRYFRLSHNGQSVLLMDSPPDSEDMDSYIKVAQYLLSAGLRAPKIYALDQINGFAIIEDFGNQTYTQLLDAGEQAEPLYQLAIDALARLHQRLDIKQIDIPRYDQGYYQDEASLFIDWYWPARTGGQISDNLRREYMAIWDQLLAQVATDNECMILRDYHVDNLMVIAGESGLNSCGLLDFQDALIGSRAYDMVSLFEDARRDVDQAMAQRLIEGYLKDFGPQQAADFHYDYNVLGAHRHIKIVGIFVRLCVRDGKSHYLDYLPRVQRLLEHSLLKPEMKPLAEWLDRNHPGFVSAPLQFDARILKGMLCETL
ncbi:phosphotransferase [Dasania sp. GY-MA-18]|uniref:Phosphotransferase n=1 Tax=Dasania phycosphaerae TaxID=2950436 RepID=A0A9J6RMQ2_9GAMM|nr:MULTISPECIES: phosphotransferase [Dasania]MCR8922830.1 phosphotransferase [Dasania sp. GY-MA-18]MCZ0865261.1 phosphotransferase [Dasania phycosphaerae]MCZ0868986.1 phosphotransferase [Dasania phycosphaerae]